MVDWNRVEVEATVAEHFVMLAAELRGEAYSKAEHRRRLSKLLANRSDGAIERKHQNISAILIERGLPYLDGYKPLSNYQRLLYDVVVARLEQAPSLMKVVEMSVTREASVPTVDDILAALVPAPRVDGKASSYADRARERPSAPRLGVDYLAIEAANRSLGSAGEIFVERFEQARLESLRLGHLAKRVERVSATRGDGLGFDILSFDESGADRLIEVKTTASGAETPFIVTRNELAVSRDKDASYYLYRVFSFRKAPRLFWKSGSLDRGFALDPERYEARLA